LVLKYEVYPNCTLDPRRFSSDAKLVFQASRPNRIRKHTKPSGARVTLTDPFDTFGERRGGTMVCALVSGSSGPETLPGTLRCVHEKNTLLSQYLDYIFYKKSFLAFYGDGKFIKLNSFDCKHRTK